MLAGLLASVLLAGLPTEPSGDPHEFNRRGYPWFGLAWTMTAQGPPVISARLRWGVRTAYDIVEFGGEAIAGGSFEAHVGGGGYLKIAPYPVGVGRIFYARSSVGRLHFQTPIGPRHEAEIQIQLGFNIPIGGMVHAGESLFFEVGAVHRRVCQDWAMPCTSSDTRWWPSLSVGGTLF